MKKLKFIEEKGYMTFELPNGKYVDILSYRYDAKVDLETESVIRANENGYSESKFPTFQKLVDMGIVKRVSCVEEHRIDLSYIRKELSDKRINKIINEFKKHGFNVTREAIKHNEMCWWRDMKSGYLDKENEYFLFTPCGCNPLSFTASTLHESCSDWQKTYSC